MKFRKKPVVVVEAIPVAHVLLGPLGVPEWILEARKAGVIWPTTPPGRGFLIETLEGTVTALEGDWIIRGVKGELYPCKRDIFVMTYEPVEDVNLGPSSLAKSKEGA